MLCFVHVFFRHINFFCEASSINSIVSIHLEVIHRYRAQKDLILHPRKVFANVRIISMKKGFVPFRLLLPAFPELLSFIP